MSMTWTKKLCINGPDAYFDWVRGPGKPYLPAYCEYPAMIRLKDGFSIMDFPAPPAGSTPPRISPLFLGDAGASHFTADLDASYLAYLESPLSISVAAFRNKVSDIVLGQKLPEDATDPTAPEYVPAPCPPPAKGTVVVGIIDEGIAFAHERFRTRSGETRVEFAWLQDARCRYNTDLARYGRELAKRDMKDASGGNAIADGIDALLARHTRGGLLDENAFYRAAGLIDFGRPGHKAAAQRVAHGAHVMDLAAGYDPSDDATATVNRPIVCVQLPSVTVADTSGIGLQKYLLDAVQYIFNRAATLAGKGAALPVVINFSSGLRAGPHDGTSPIETALDDIIVRRRRETGAPTEIVLPVGNSRLTRGHACIDLKPKGSEILRWRVLPDDQTFSFVEIWLPCRRADQNIQEPGIGLSITPPGSADKSPPLCQTEDRKARAWQSAAGAVVCKVYYEDVAVRTVGAVLPPAKGTDDRYVRGRFLVALLPTAYHDAPTPLAPSGVWQIELTNTSTTAQTIDAWIHWDDRPIGYPRRGRQSYFDEPKYIRYTYPAGRVEDPGSTKVLDDASIVKRASTANALATGYETVVLAGYRRKGERPATYSSAGPKVKLPWEYDLGVNVPDAASVCDDADLRPGVLAAGSRSGSFVAMNGTSVAAPPVTRFLADEMAKLEVPDGGARLPTKFGGKAIVRKRGRQCDGLNPSEEPRIGAGRLYLPSHRDTPATRWREKP